MPLRSRRELEANLSADTVSIALGADGLDSQKVIGIAPVVPPKDSWTTVCCNEHIEIAVIVDVTVGCTPGDPRNPEAGAYQLGDFGKLLVAAVVEQMGRLGVRHPSSAPC